MGVIRAGHKRWGPKHRAKEAARRPSQSANKRLKWEYQCAHCKDWFADKEVEVDHIIPCGSCRCEDDLVPYFRRTFVEEDGYQVLCKPDHLKKTNREGELRRASNSQYVTIQPPIS